MGVSAGFLVDIRLQCTGHVITSYTIIHVVSAVRAVGQFI